MFGNILHIPYIFSCHADKIERNAKKFKLKVLEQPLTLILLQNLFAFLLYVGKEKRDLRCIQFCQKKISSFIYEHP